MKKIEEEHEVNLILELYNTNISLRGIAKQLNRSQSYIQRIINDSKFNTQLTSDKNHQWIAKCKITKEEFYDIKNKSGVLTTHVLKLYPNLILPSKFKRKQVLIQTNKHWFEEYFDLIQIVKPEIKICKYCNWETFDITNTSGAYTTHLKETHKKSIVNYIKDFPDEKTLFKTHNDKQDLSEFIKSNSKNYIKCELCGELMRIITNKHLKVKHPGITQQEYKIKYGSIISQTSSKKISDNTIKSNIEHFSFNKNKRNGMELQFENVLKRCNIKYEYNKPINKYLFDFYLNDYDIFIELDGMYWHGHDRKSEWDFNIFRNILKDYNKSKLIPEYKLIRLIEGISVNYKNLNQINSIDSLFNFFQQENFNIKNHKLFNLKENEIIFSKNQCKKIIENTNNNFKFIEKLLFDFEYLIRTFYYPENFSKFININERTTIEFKLKGVFYSSFYQARKNGNKNLNEYFLQGNTLSKVIRYRFGLNKNTELFDINIKNIYRGIEVMTLCNVGIFPVKKSTEIYNNNVFDNSVVYDPFAGWGSRLIGMENLIKFKNCIYKGEDINETLMDGYTWIHKEIFNESKIKYFNIRNSIILNNNLMNKIDFIFTSPPFYNDELYTKNSIRYDSIEEWENSLLIPVFQNCYKYLKPNCKIIIDIKSTYRDSIINSMNKANLKFIDNEIYNISKSHYGKQVKQNELLVFIK